VKFPYLSHYGLETQEQVAALFAQDQLTTWLLKKYPQAHGFRTDKALYDYTSDLKLSFLKGADPVTKVHFDSKLRIVQNALGTHTTIARVQGNKLKAKREIRIASLFKDAPEPFLKMIVVHELAHLREREHGKAFYQLCTYMESNYHQLEFELRVYLTHLDQGGARLWD
jgi:predicted metal-dependent hydrolase